MSPTVQLVLLWCLVVNLGVAFGAGIYEHRIVVSRWLHSVAGAELQWDAAAARADDTGRRFWAWATTAPLTLLTLANLYAGWFAAGAVGDWWRGAATVALADRLVTFLYFVPVMVQLMRAEHSPAAAARARRWSLLNYGRHVLVFAAWMAALQAFGLLFAEPR